MSATPPHASNGKKFILSAIGAALCPLLSSLSRPAIPRQGIKSVQANPTPSRTVTIVRKHHPPSIPWFIAGAIFGCLIPLGIGILVSAGMAAITRGNTDSAKRGGIIETMIPPVIIACLIIVF